MNTYIVLESIKLERQYAVVAADENEAAAMVNRGQATALRENEADELSYEALTRDEFIDDWGYDPLQPGDRLTVGASG